MKSIQITLWQEEGIYSGEWEMLGSSAFDELQIIYFCRVFEKQRMKNGVSKTATPYNNENIKCIANVKVKGAC